MNEALQEELANASARLLNAIQETALAQYKLVETRKDRDSTPEVVSDAAYEFRRTEAMAQEALSALLELHVNIFQAGEAAGDAGVGPRSPAAEPPSEPTSPEKWRAGNV